MKNLSLKAIFTCDYALMDANQKPSIIGIFQNINVKTLPSKYLSMTVALFLDTPDINDNENFELEMKLKKPDNNYSELNLPSLKIDSSPSAKMKEGLVFISLGNVDFDMEGKYTFEVFSNKAKIGEQVFNVKLNI